MRFSVLGSLTIHRDGSAIALNAHMLRRLLAVLLVRANSPITMDELIASLWGDSAPAGARKTVQIYMHRLRQAIGDEQRIQHELGGYRLKVSADELDVKTFSRLVAQGRSLCTEDKLGEAADRLNQALALWRGAAYEDMCERPPVVDEARRLDEERLRVTSEHIGIRLRLSGPSPGSGFVHIGTDRADHRQWRGGQDGSQKLAQFREVPSRWLCSAGVARTPVLMLYGRDGVDRD